MGIELYVYRYWSVHVYLHTYQHCSLEALQRNQHQKEPDPSIQLHVVVGKARTDHSDLKSDADTGTVVDRTGVAGLPCPLGLHTI